MKEGEKQGFGSKGRLIKNPGEVTLSDMLLEMIPESKAKRLITLVPFHLKGDIPTLIEVISHAKTKPRNSSLKTKSKKAKTNSKKVKDKKKSETDCTPSYSSPAEHFIAECSSSYCSMENGKLTWKLGRVT